MAIAEIAAVAGAAGAFLLPVYVALWNINRALGHISAKTDHNEAAIEDISDAVGRIEGEVRSNSLEIETADA